jgi:prophage regulatory protein
MNMAQQIASAAVALRVKQVAARLNLSRATIYSLGNPRSPSFDPNFPKRVRLSPGCAVFLESEITAWLKQRVELTRATD